RCYRHCTRSERGSHRFDDAQDHGWSVASHFHLISPRTGRKGTTAMTATNGGIRGLSSEINVTPMIDVLLVLLIIFMVIVPAVPRGEAALVPHPAPMMSAEPDAVVLEVIKGADNAIEFRI